MAQKSMCYTCCVCAQIDKNLLSLSDLIVIGTGALPLNCTVGLICDAFFIRSSDYILGVGKNYSACG